VRVVCRLSLGVVDSIAATVAATIVASCCWPRRVRRAQHWRELLAGCCRSGRRIVRERCNFRGVQVGKSECRRRVSSCRR